MLPDFQLTSSIYIVATRLSASASFLLQITPLHCSCSSPPPSSVPSLPLLLFFLKSLHSTPLPPSLRRHLAPCLSSSTSFISQITSLYFFQSSAAVSLRAYTTARLRLFFHYRIDFARDRGGTSAICQLPPPKRSSISHLPLGWLPLFCCRRNISTCLASGI